MDADGIRPLFTPFGLANYIGAIADLILCMLIAISSNAMLRGLGPARWKGLQRWTYVAAAMTVAHALLYQFVEGRTFPFVAIVLAISAIVLVLQARGRRAQLDLIADHRRAPRM